MIYLSYEMDLVQAFFPLHNMCTSSLKHNGMNEKKKMLNTSHVLFCNQAS